MTEKTTVPVKTDGQAPVRRRDPMDLFDELRQDMARMWTSLWPMGPRPLRQFASAAELAWAPSMDVFEKDNAIVIKAELPGVKKDDIHVTIEDNDVIIRGERKSESEVKEDQFYRLERAYGSFYRRLPLGIDVKAADIKATFDNGVLEVRIPKPAAAKPEAQKIAIR